MPAQPDDAFRLTDGTVVDHLPAGSATRALALLQLPREGPVTVGMNVPSRRHGLKDIVRVEGLVLKKRELDRLALLGRQVTVSIVRRGAVSEKQVLEVPARIEGILACPNPTCITRSEAVRTVFHRQGEYPYRFRCHHCERVMSGEDAQHSLAR
ncbi:MAG: aspartate carbamoyltransferase regulatory subunit [Planctomycetia bacterium]